jgi:hypothetical protein
VAVEILHGVPMVAAPVAARPETKK